MYCPKCRCEYRDGFTECWDCKISLVEELPAEETPKNLEFQEIASNLRQDEISIMKSILDANGVRYLIQGEIAGTNLKSSSLIKLVVLKEDYDLVLELLESFL